MKTANAASSRVACTRPRNRLPRAQNTHPHSSTKKKWSNSLEIRGLGVKHHLLRIFLGEVSKKVAKSHLNRCRRRWKTRVLARHSRHSATVLSSDLRNNRTNEMIGDRETGHRPPRRPLQCSVQDDTLEHHFVLRRLWKR